MNDVNWKLVKIVEYMIRQIVNKLFNHSLMLENSISVCYSRQTNHCTFSFHLSNFS